MKVSASLVLLSLMIGAHSSAHARGQRYPADTPQAATQDSANELFVAVGKSVLIDVTRPIQRVAVGLGDVAEATAVSPQEILVNGKAAGDTSLIVWEAGGGRQFYNVVVRPSPSIANDRLDGLRRELRAELPGQPIRVTSDNDQIFLRGTVKDLTSSARAIQIASTAGKVVNLLYVDVPSSEPQILLKVRSVCPVLGSFVFAHTYNQPPAPDPAARTPATLRGAPLWLQQDRAYQSAAAHFYATDYDAAVTGFRTIGADEASPWSPVSRYLVARALLRKVTMLGDHGQDTAADAVKAAAASAARATGLKQVRSELLALQGLPRMAPLRGAIDNLLDYVNIRLQPEQQAVTLAERLHGTDSSRFEQSLIDLTYLRTNQSDPTLPATPDTPGAGANDMLTWIDAVANANEATALSQWRKGHATAWLLAALMAANPGDAPAAELIAAARAVPPADPGYIAVTYHRLRLMPHDAATRAELLPVLAAVQTAQTTSTLNLFTSLAGASAPSLEEWLRAAGRVPAGETIWGETSDDTTDTSAVQEDVCGTKVAPNTTRLFDADAATALNLHFPLRLLAAAAESRTLPANLQFQVAQAAWARAVLLDQPAIARRMSPLLIHCRIAWKPVLTAYDGSATAADREANGLLALMRFASTEPSVREGEERRNGFAAYDEFRQNWWCSTVPDEGGSVDSDAVVMAKASADLPAKSKTGTPLPLFLTATDRREADAEVLALRKIPRASQYVGLRALAWYRAHPKDPRTPDILGEADRVIRNSCRNDPPYDPKTGKAVGNPTDLTLTANLAHAIFDVLQRAYPQSAWAKRYTTWE